MDVKAWNDLCDIKTKSLEANPGLILSGCKMSCISTCWALLKLKYQFKKQNKTKRNSTFSIFGNVQLEKV